MAPDVPDPPRQMTKPNDKRRTIMVTLAILVALVVVVASVAWFVIEGPFDRNGTYDHYYFVRVEANSTEEYTISLPVPTNESGVMPVRFMQDLEVAMGEPVFALGDTVHGKAIEVRASGYLEFSWSKQWPESWDERYGNLTMTTGAEGWEDRGPCVSWIYSDRPDIRIYFMYESIHEYMSAPHWASGGGPTFSFYMYPDGNGWQQVSVDYGWMIIN